MGKGKALAEEPEKGIRIQCTNKKCRRKWMYRGSRRFYASCPDCHTSVRIRLVQGGSE